MKTQAINRHILAMMGISVWVDSNQTVAHFDSTALSRFKTDDSSVNEPKTNSKPSDDSNKISSSPNLSSPSLLSSNIDIKTAMANSRAYFNAQTFDAQSVDVHSLNAQSIKMQSFDVQHNINSGDDLSEKSNTSSNTAQHDSLQSSTMLASAPAVKLSLPSHLSDVRLLQDKFDLMAMRFNDWLLIVNKMTATTAELSIANSLANKLTNEGAVFLEANYPLVDDVVNQKNAQAALMGFLVRLYNDGNDALNIGLLNEISEVDFGQLNQKIIKIPTLKQMHNDNKYKLILWNLLHSMD